MTSAWPPVYSRKCEESQTSPGVVPKKRAVGLEGMHRHAVGVLAEEVVRAVGGGRQEVGREARVQGGPAIPAVLALEDPAGGEAHVEVIGVARVDQDGVGDGPAGGLAQEARVALELLEPGEVLAEGGHLFPRSRRRPPSGTARAGRSRPTTRRAAEGGRGSARTPCPPIGCCRAGRQGACGFPASSGPGRPTTPRWAPGARCGSPPPTGPRAAGRPRRR